MFICYMFIYIYMLYFYIYIYQVFSFQLSFHITISMSRHLIHHGHQPTAPTPASFMCVQMLQSVPLQITQSNSRCVRCWEIKVKFDPNSEPKMCCCSGSLAAMLTILFQAIFRIYLCINR